MASQYLTEMFSLEGKTAICTGATGGLGTAMSVALVKAGASIVSLELPDDPLSADFNKKIHDAGGKVSTFHCNLKDKDSIRSTFKAIWDSGVVPDILLNCAGVMKRNLCENATDDELDLLVDVNIKSFYVCMQEFGRKLLSLNRPGKIVNIASVTSYQAGFNTSVYSSTKGAVLQMTKAFSNEWASKGIQVNAIAPGFMRTNMTAQYQDNQQMIDYLMLRVPMARWGQPEDLVPGLLFLVAPSNTFTSGIALIIDGGFCGK
ncbi:hypothetical protein LTR99_006697 [Exophiala xenobiotica]|uniref:2-deoxy-D-gluconate 3-dehydrogenase n=1 Tax=Vermiconidia calcicola TaxID=1690605 RepID=A0AAV9QD90_9PEZI|nr:hypothetical protein LTR92_007906 [Exophiala xenobiotica]KAK5533691.1 hypothetical protein LTR23_009071 [Chaetothyriales sp. CCFEE 6169]KAK5537866.1 hypothetical protein LTR25_005118 [Vermiconidia calcicola]KAK5205296.1 hypothetical protein LTR41_009145 [Exophiala xenobiotica]KAK5218927.1 hypothetical protein LTR72_008109 [Exophiala xenobiotica]